MPAKRIDQASIIKLYETGMSEMNVAKISHCSQPSVHQILARYGKTRTRSQGRLCAIDGWQKVFSRPDGRSRGIVLPSTRLSEAEINTDADLLGKWKVLGKGRLELEVKEAQS